jgi:hypothetical protein
MHKLASHPSIILSLALVTAGCGDSKSSDTDTDTTSGPEAEPPVELDASGCVPKCVKDIDPSTIDLVEPDCKVCDYHPTDQTCDELVECVEILGELQPPAGERTCFFFRFDDGYTPSPLDDLSQACLDRGLHGEYFVLRYDDAPADTVVTVSCTWSPDPATDCPSQ